MCIIGFARHKCHCKSEIIVLTKLSNLISLLSAMQESTLLDLGADSKHFIKLSRELK